ncbi:transcriptional regulator, partial [Burkholderia sp. Ac-20353]|nr:transcriptional regulator [Burkholderia sp. Ac-20353]
FACGCLDWSERRAHLGGALGAALLDSFCAHGWIERTERPRVLRVTVPGQQALDAWLTTA